MNMFFACVSNWSMDLVCLLMCANLMVTASMLNVYWQMLFILFQLPVFCHCFFFIFILKTMFKPLIVSIAVNANSTVTVQNPKHFPFNLR